MRTLMAAAAVATLALSAHPLQAQAHEHHGTPAAHSAQHQDRHPAPRPGVTAARVLRPERFSTPARRAAYAAARQVPQLLDGIYCHCECHETKGLRSLLSCYESEMASTCGICQGQARMALQMHKDGKSLDEIRAAVDADYGGRE